MEIVLENGAHGLQVRLADGMMAAPPRNYSSRLWSNDRLAEHHLHHFHHHHQSTYLDPMSGMPVIVQPPGLAVRRARPLLPTTIYSCRGRRSSSLGSTSESSDYDTDSDEELGACRW